MKTKNFIGLSNHLLPGLPGFAARKNLIFIVPVGDNLRGLSFQGSADAKWFYFSVFFLPLFVPTDTVHGTFGRRIGKATNWNSDNPSLVQDLGRVIQCEAIPF